MATTGKRPLGCALALPLALVLWAVLAGLALLALYLAYQQF